jgi:hypothetical protein
VLLSVYVLLFAVIVGLAWKRSVSLRPLLMIVFSTTLFMTESSVAGFQLGQSFYPIFANVVPAFIYISAAAITFVALKGTADRLSTFLSLMRIICIAYIVLHVLVIVVTRGTINLTTSRYEVLSGAVVPCLGIIAVGMVVRLRRLDVFALILNLLVALLSVTRTLLVVLGVQILAVLFSRPSAIFRSAAIKGIAILLFALSMIVVLDKSLGTGLTDRWIQRITFSQKVHADPTALTRGAEVHFMLEHFATSTSTMLFGNGLAAVTSLTGPDASRAARIVGWGSLGIHSIGYGHQNYASILFVSGLLGGGCLLLIQVWNGLQSVAFIRRYQLNRSLCDMETAHIGVWGGIIVIGMLTLGLFGGTLGDRAACIWYGIGTGMLYWARDVTRLNSTSKSNMSTAD